MIRPFCTRISVTLLLLCTTACSPRFYAAGAVQVERGLTAGNEAWDKHYNAELERCKEVAQPGTPEAEECFGKTFDTNQKIGVGIESAVAALRTFWVAYAAGADPKQLRSILAEEVPKVLADLPDEFFGGLKKAKGKK